MCGIVGITSNKEVTTRIINSLKKLEYRGYDSAGIATLKDGFINEVKCEGRVNALEKNLLNVQLKGQDHYVFINDRKKAQVVFKDGQWIAEHIRTAILKFNYEVDKIDKLLVRDFTDDEVKEYEKTS